MADKQISQLVAATTINNDDLFVMQQGGTAKKLSGQKLSDFVYQSAADQIERVDEAVEQAQAAVDSLEEQKNEIAQTIASMAELGTDTTLSTPGMAADAAATGEAVAGLSSQISVLEPTATSADIGKALIVKTVESDKVTEYEFGDAGGSASSDIVKTVSGVVASFFGGVYGSKVKKLVADIVPFTGVTQCNVYSRGKQLINESLTWVRKVNNAIEVPTTFQNGVWTVSETSNRTSILKMGVFKAGIYAISLTSLSGTSVSVYNDGSGARLALLTTNTKAVTFTLLTDAELYLQIDVKANEPFTITNLLLEQGSSSNEYEPFNGSIITYTFPVAAGTVFGGTPPINEDGSGELIVYPYYSSYNGETLTGHWISDRDVYEEGTTPTIGAQVVNDGGTPTEYQLTSQQVVTVLRGHNNIWADTGNVEITYYVDTVQYVDEKDNLVKALSAPVLVSMKTDKALYTDEFCIVDDTLYQITAYVAPGTTLIEGVNCRVRTVSEILTTLLRQSSIPTPLNPSNGQYLKFNGTDWIADDLPVYDGSVT